MFFFNLISHLFNLVFLFLFQLVIFYQFVYFYLSAYLFIYLFIQFFYFILFLFIFIYLFSFYLFQSFLIVHHFKISFSSVCLHVMSQFLVKNTFYILMRKQQTSSGLSCKLWIICFVLDGECRHFEKTTANQLYQLIAIICFNLHENEYLCLSSFGPDLKTQGDLTLYLLYQKLWQPLSSPQRRGQTQIYIFV
ncbi:transmembrane protein, putative (macronuclear) [Tetrahymena thermophila SB210]|uniref:Transmembrane protein, putative n=1 Tax=Tetrahymena thermophila (strain SB210) TaxID=312017 RepID=W7XIM3_TETTS|nr:transmembrane protein, putative [Tetrahymena thermophila SB210]EWS73424.1 transmembrane protein, putative [Tetrahymena thermophila SB210]|eukprot:XP_012654040.1 transmembrane protein, putative [Tetrahymena thermophila SB210]